MSKQDGAVEKPVPNRRSLPASYLEGAVPISVPQKPSTPVAKSHRRSASFVQLYTGPPIDLVDENESTPLSSRISSNSTPSSKSNKTAKASNGTPSSTSNPTSVPNPISTLFSTLPQGPHPHDPAESFAAARLESLIPLSFIASASDDRHNVILPPSAPKPAPTSYTILFDAAHALIMHQALVSGTAQSARQKKQLEELTRISYRQAKFIVELERQNALLRGLAGKGGLQGSDSGHRPTEISTTTMTMTTKNKTNKRKREEEKNKKEKETQELAACVDGLGNKIEGQGQKAQRRERERKTRKVLKQRESLLQDSDGDQ